MYSDRRLRPETDHECYTIEPQQELDEASISGTASLACHGILPEAVAEAAGVSSVPSRGPNPSILISEKTTDPSAAFAGSHYRQECFSTDRPNRHSRTGTAG
jgi:hypothetical protein